MAVLTYTSQVNKLTKAIALPLLLLIGVLTFEHYRSLLGAPISARPVGEIAYIHHEIVSTLEGDASIIIWIFDRELGDRLYQYPYNRIDAERLTNARSNSADGDQNVILDFGVTGSPGIDSRRDWTIEGERFIKQ